MIGDVMLDRFVYGEVTRISPEAPIQVFRETDNSTEMLGGAGNLGRNIAALGGQSILVGLVGDDADGVAVRRLAAETDGLKALFVDNQGRPTTVKTRYVCKGHQILRVDREDSVLRNASLAETIKEHAIRAIHGDFGQVDSVVLSDYAKGVLSEAVIEPIVSAAKAFGTPVLADPKRSDLSFYGAVDVLTPNAGELAAATGARVSTNEEAEGAGRAALGRCQSRALVVTRAERGMSVVRRDAAAVHWPAQARQVFDVSGAGDTVLAVLSLGMASSLTVVEAAELANVAGGLVVQKAGTATLTHSELAEALMNMKSRNEDSKQFDRDSLINRVARWRNQGLRIGFTNGCFDLIHPGHASLLRQARSACDRLVVGLNSDESVKRLKGPNRPIQPQLARASVLAAMAAVDAVTTFADDTPMDLITALRPDVLVKGADYTVTTVVGADFVHSYGGRVLLADIQAGHSTSEIIERQKMCVGE